MLDFCKNNQNYILSGLAIVGVGVLTYYGYRNYYPKNDPKPRDIKDK